MSSQLAIRSRIFMTSTNGKTFTYPTSIRFSMLDVFTYHHFPPLFYLTAFVAPFPTFLFGVLCDANEVCVPPSFPRFKPISLNCPHQQVVRNVSLFERDH